MGRRSNSGLDYFSFDIDFFTDPKIEFVEAVHGNLALVVAIRLLCKIYRQGYYIEWGEDEALIFAKKAGGEITKEFVDKTIQELLKRDFFHQKLFKDFKILTSNGIQIRYLESTRRRSCVSVFKEYLIADINGFGVDIKELNTDISTQSKVKESKVKESKKKIRFGDRVLLTKEEYGKLVKRFGKDGADGKIIDLDLGIQSKGYKYDSHYSTILSWERMDEKRRKEDSATARSKIGTSDDFPGASGKIDFGES